MEIDWTTDSAPSPSVMGFCASPPLPADCSSPVRMALAVWLALLNGKLWMGPERRPYWHSTLESAPCTLASCYEKAMPRVKGVKEATCEEDRGQTLSHSANLPLTELPTQASVQMKLNKLNKTQVSDTKSKVICLFQWFSFHKNSKSQFYKNVGVMSSICILSTF